MQLSSVYLYPNKIDVFTQSLDPWVAERYRKVYNRNVKIYRGADNRIDIQVRNCDQKPVSVANSYLVFNLVTKDKQRLVLRKDCVLVPDDSTNKLKGRAYALLSKEEMQDLEPGFYQYSVVREERDYESPDYVVTSSSLTYVDSQFGAYATLEIFGDVAGEPQHSLEISKFNYINPFSTGDEDLPYFESSIIDAQYLTSIPSSTHTFQFFQGSDFTGRIRIQGSLDESTDPVTWVDLPDAVIEPGGNNFTTNGQSTLYKNVTGKWRWFRVIAGASFNGSAKFVIAQTTLGEYAVSVYNGGKNYVVGQQLIIVGDKLGGYSGVNDLAIVVQSVNYQGAITSVSWSGTSVMNTRSFVLGATGEPTTGKVDKVLYR
jgi:hypothetical protein